MPGMAQGAHRGRPFAAAPCTPGLRPAKSPLRGTFDLSLQASGRAEAASVQNTALSPHPCGLPRPSGNVSAILRPQHRQFQSHKWVNQRQVARTPGRARREPPPGIKAAPCLRSSPGDAVACQAWSIGAYARSRRPDKAFMPPSGTATGTVPDCPAALRLPGLRYMRLRGAGDNVIGMQLY